MACNPTDTRPHHDPDTTSSGDLVFSEQGLGPAQFCVRLNKAAATLGPARDTSVESEDVLWLARVVHLSDGGRVLLESSWRDWARLRRLTTTSQSVRTRSGARVGMTVAELPSASRPQRYQAHGQLSFYLAGDSVFALVDTWAATSRVQALTVAAACCHRDAAA